jgi:2,3-bisphosphoglycerate-independent phosphoglycerate mutase
MPQKSDRSLSHKILDPHLRLLHELSQPGERILFVVLDGIGDLPGPQGFTPLEVARTPNLDHLARQGMLGLVDPVFRGITPGSGIGHLSLFGYDPLTYWVERGVIEALGAGLELGPQDVAVRGNFVLLDDRGNISDRRAGRLSDEEGRRLIEILEKKLPRTIGGVRIEFRHLKEYRFALVLRGKSLGASVTDTDPQRTGVPSLPAEGKDQRSRTTARILNEIARRARSALKLEKPYGVTFRGAGKKPPIPTYEELFGIRGAVVAHYPMYRGVGKLIGFTILPVEGQGEALPEKIAVVKRHFQEYDLVFLHIKKTDSMGEDGRFEGKVELIEEFDRWLPELLALNPPVLVITGDHSTPVPMRSHSWHPVPVLLKGRYIRFAQPGRFTESSALTGFLGRMRGVELIAEVLALAGRLKKFGA